LFLKFYEDKERGSPEGGLNNLAAKTVTFAENSINFEALI